MLKKWPILVMTLAMAGVANAAITPVTPNTDANDGCYLISNAAELYGFADMVNAENATACGKLDADITVNENVLGANNANVDADGSYNNAQAASSFTPWTPIGNSTKKFQGSFNGKGHTISGLYFNNSTTSNVGLFGYTYGAVTIDSVGVVDSYFRGADNVGSIVGQAESTGSGKLLKALTVIRSYNKGFVMGSSNVGGLVGKNGNVQFSYNTGSVTGTSVTGTSYVGGLVGSNTSAFKINGSYNIGLVKKGTGAGNSVLGYGCPKGGQTGAVQNVYYLEGAGDECSGAYSMTSYEFADGFVAITLHGDNSITGTGADIWGQVVGTDETPLLTGKIVFPITLDNSDNCYEISNADNLYIFAAIVNSGFKSDACGKLTKDIVVNENVLANVNADGSLKDGVNFKEWTPIGLGTTNMYKMVNLFSGEFHGQGHTISGLYFNDTKKVNVGLFGYVNGTVTIDGVGLVDSYINAGGWVGGLVGIAHGSLTISDSYNASSVNTPDLGFGGLVGAARGIYDGENLIERGLLTISNSYNEGSLNGGYWGGGLVGYADALVVSNSYNVGSMHIGGSGEDAFIGGITSSVDNASTVTNSYNYGAISYPTDNIVSKDDLVPEGGGEDDVTVTNSFTIGTSRFEGDGSTKKSVTEFADGTVFAALRNAEGGEVWRQYSGDAYPTFVKKSGTTFEPNADGYYEIATADDLYKFAEIVNNGTAVGSRTELGVKAKLMNDICVNACGEGESVLKADGTLNGNGSSFTPWTPIGIAGYPFIGTFDGQGHTISGLYFNDASASNVGLFGYVSGEDVTVSIGNVGVEDSYFRANSAVGGVVGYAEYVALDMKNVFNAAVVEGSSFVGGVVGFVTLDENQTSIMVNVYNVGSIKGKDAGQAGGLVGDFMNDYETSMLTIKNSYNYGDVAGGNPLVGKVENEYENVSVTNSYYLGSSSSGDYGTVKSSTQFSDGTVYAALHSAKDGDVWFQKPGDKFPTLSQEKNGPVTHEVVLNYPKAGSTSDYDQETILYVEGFVKSLPTIDKEGYPILGWYTSGHENSPITEIPATSTSDMTLFPKLFVPFVNGCYEIATAEQLYWFAAIVNKGNVNACGKLTANIEVNENVLATAGGVSNVNATTGAYTGTTTGLREWTPIGNETNPFQGTFDGQGYTISGLYFNGENVYDVGLFGRVAGDTDGASVANVNVADSYFGDKGGTGDHVGGIVGMVTHGGVVNVKNVSSAAVVVGNDDVGGVVGYVLGTEGDLELNIANAYNVGMVKGSDGVGGLVGDVTIDRAAHKVAINNSYNYGDVSFEKTDGGPLIGSVKNTADVAKIDVNNSYYLGNAANGKYGEYRTATEFADGTVLTKLRDGEGGSVWVQNLGDIYPTININGSTNPYTLVLDWQSAGDRVNLKDLLTRYSSYGTLNVIVKSGKTFYADGKIYSGNISTADVSDICSKNKTLYPISGVELATDGYGITTATLNGKDDARTTVMIPTNVEVDRVVYQRKITANTYMTVMLPFDVNVVNNMSVNGKYTFYKFCGVDSDNLGTIINVAPVTTKFKANRPYIMIANADNSEGITFEKVGDSKYTLNTTTSSTDVTKDNWTMRGVYEYKVWPEDDEDLGYVYGFASKAGSGNQIGEFVEAGAGADIVPMRMYLKGTKPQSVRGNGKYNYSSHTGPAKVVRVQIVEGDGDDETTAIKHVATVPTVVKSNRWFDVKGRALNGKPTAKGTYYYNGQRVIIK